MPRLSLHRDGVPGCGVGGETDYDSTSIRIVRHGEHSLQSFVPCRVPCSKPQPKPESCCIRKSRIDSTTSPRSTSRPKNPPCGSSTRLVLSITQPIAITAYSTSRRPPCSRRTRLAPFTRTKRRPTRVWMPCERKWWSKRTLVTPKEYLDPDKRSIANAIQVVFRDGSKTDRVEIEYPLGHRRRRAESVPHIEAKFVANSKTQFQDGHVSELLALFQDRTELDSMRVSKLMDRLVTAQ